MNNAKKILEELKHHIPFTSIATLLAIFLVIIFRQINFAESFEVLHPLHVIASAIVTSAIYYKYKKNIFNAFLIGLTGSILIGSLSDVILPYLGGVIFNLETKFHLPIIEEPIIILLSSTIGSIIGIKSELTKFPHLIHVFLSIFASLFYLIAFSAQLTPIYIFFSFIIVFIAVLIPCCISDIIYPLLFIKNKK